MASGSKTAVVFAIAGNSTVTILKFAAAQITLSASMMNEAVHSFMDTVNQVFLLMGLRHGGKPADQQYAFGHGQKKYLWNLWSAIGLFSIGAGLGFAHAWHSYHALAEGYVAGSGMVNLVGINIDTIWVSVIVLAIALVIEGYVLLVAVREVLSRMKNESESRFFSYVRRADDPTLLAILLEDSVAVLGVILAACGIGLTRVTGNAIWDILFSVIIALLLAIVAIVLGAINMRYLSAIRDPQAENAFREVVKSSPEIEQFHDLRSIIVDESNTVLVAEIELREEVLMRDLNTRVEEFERQYREVLPREHQENADVHAYIHSRSVIQATLERTEQLIDQLERNIRQRCPQVMHITIEVEGMAPLPTPNPG